MLIRRLRYWLRRADREASLREEMELHLQERAAELRGEGRSDGDARAEARRCFGNALLKREESREVWLVRSWSEFWQDLRHGARCLKRDPGFAAVAVLSAGLGIGACSTIFSIANFAVFRPLPVAEPERLMALSAVDERGGIPGQTMSFPEIRDLRRDSRSWQGVAAFAPLLPAGIRPQGGTARRYSGFLVSSNYFDVVRPAFAVGGGFDPALDDHPGASPKIVLTHHVWVSQFGADPGVVGQTISVNKRWMLVTGITAAGFRGTEAGLAADFFLPLSQIAEMRRLGEDPARMTNYGARWLMCLGRLRDGVTLQQAQAELEAAARSVRERGGVTERDRGFSAERAGQLLPSIRAQALPAFVLLFAVTALVSVTGCANIANLMLARASARSKEIATRLALGAGRGRLIRQLLTESLILAAGGGGLGLALTAWAVRHIGAFRLPVPLPLDLSIPVDWRVVVFSAALSVVTGVVFGLIPALRASSPNLAGPMTRDGGNIASLRRFGLRNALVVAQVAISATLAICAGLFERSLMAVRDIDTGMQAHDLTLVGFDPALLRYDTQQTRTLLAGALQDVEALPGVSSASVTSFLPLSLGANFTQASSGRTMPGSGEVRTAVVSIGPRYFQTMGTPLISGGEFAPAPGNEGTVIVNQELARRLFPDRDPLGQSVRCGGRLSRVVGVAANAKHETMLQSRPTPVLYQPILDLPASKAAGGLTLIVNSARDAGPLSVAVRRLLLAREPELVVTLAGTMGSHIQESLFVPRLAASLFGLCGVMGLLIASIGVYGVMSFAVARRTREIGIRMALGARSAQVLGMVLWHGVGVAFAGLVMGIAGGLILARAARGLISGVSETDPFAFLVASAAVLLPVFIATMIAAHRAVSVDPRRTLQVG